MKNKLAYIGLASLLFTTAFTACDSEDNDFPDFDYQTVYFANQNALRTIELGDEEFVDNSLDNEHCCNILATWGGGYGNSKNIQINYVVDPSLCDGLYFAGTNTPVSVMPESYYTLSSDKLLIPSGKISGGVKVQLTDAFFQDERAVESYYVIPLRMTEVSGADSILLGKPNVASPLWTKADDWAVAPKNYVLYCIKFVNPWHGEYLRRGVDQITENGSSRQNVRHGQYVEKDEACQVVTSAFKDDKLALTVKDSNGLNHSFTLKLSFQDDGSCSVSSATQGVTAQGTGSFVQKGEKNSLGGKDRNAIYLDYSVNMQAQNMQIASKDTLVLRTRNVYGGTTFDVERK